MFPINIFVNYFWKVNDEFMISGLLTRLTNNNQYVLTDSLGNIEECTEGFFTFLREVYDQKLIK